MQRAQVFRTWSVFQLTLAASMVVMGVAALFEANTLLVGVWYLVSAAVFMWYKGSDRLVIFLILLPLILDLPYVTREAIEGRALAIDAARSLVIFATVIRYLFNNPLLGYDPDIEKLDES